MTEEVKSIGFIELIKLIRHSAMDSEGYSFIGIKNAKEIAEALRNNGLVKIEPNAKVLYKPKKKIQI